MTGLRIRAVLQRPTDEAGDQILKLQESGAGIYRTDVVIGGGVWVADITAEKSDTELVRFVQRIFVK
jgi:nitrogen fixation protein FixH